jgi:hypothetical protein
MGSPGLELMKGRCYVFAVVHKGQETSVGHEIR